MKPNNKRWEDQFIIRDVSVADIHRLAVLHVKAWNETYHNTAPDPSVATREWQWRQAFENEDGSWFCFLIENRDGDLVGFAKGAAYQQSSLPQFTGELNKLYLLKAYQKLGLGKRLVAQVFQRFISMGINAVVLFGEAQNPSGGFHEAMGAEKLYVANGEFHGGYGWTDITSALKNINAA